MNQMSIKRLGKVHPLLRERIINLTAEYNRRFTVSLEVVQGLRTHAEQNKLFAKGRTTKGAIVTNARGGQSFHNYGLAVDVCPFRGDVALWNEEKLFDVLDEYATRFSLEWGGDWRTPDRPHLQLRGFKSWRDCSQIFTLSGIAGVWTEATRRNK